MTDTYTSNVKYCPMNDGDDCLRCPDCNERAKDEPMAKPEPVNRILEIAQRIRLMQTARAGEATQAAVVGE